MRIIKAKFTSSEAFLNAYQDQFRTGGIFIPTRLALELGSSVVVDLRFPELRSRVLFRGSVAWRRAGRHRTKLRAGLGIEFSPSEHRKCDFVLAVARGDVVDLVQRRHRRLPVSLDVTWRAKEDASRYASNIDDIGEGGAFIRTHDFLPIGSVVLLEVTPPRSLVPILIEGRVAWTHHTEGEEGMGVEFRCRDIGGARRLRELVQRCERTELRLVNG